MIIYLASGAHLFISMGWYLTDLSTHRALTLALSSDHCITRMLSWGRRCRGRFALLWMPQMGQHTRLSHCCSDARGVFTSYCHNESLDPSSAGAWGTTEFVLCILSSLEHSVQNSTTTRIWWNDSHEAAKLQAVHFYYIQGRRTFSDVFTAEVFRGNLRCN